MEILPFLLAPFLASLILTGIHAYLGVHVVERGVIFVDLALAQIAALGATIAAGMDGVRRGLDPGEPVDVDPGRLPEIERSKRGVDPLPTNLGDAIYHLSRDQTLLDALGAELAQAYLAVTSYYVAKAESEKRGC